MLPDQTKASGLSAGSIFSMCLPLATIGKKTTSSRTHGPRTQCLSGLSEKQPLRSNNFYPDAYDERWTHFSPDGFGLDIDKQVIIYRRWGATANGGMERFVVVLNFSDQDQHVDMPFSDNGIWKDLLNGDQVRVVSYQLQNCRVPSNWGCVFWQEA